MKSLVPPFVATAMVGCTSPGFPEDFQFGAATAGFQIEMGCPTVPAEQCEDRASDWYAFVTSTVAMARSGNHLAGDAPSRGPGYYELFEEDLARAEELGLQAFRFSFEWSRIFPSSTRGIEGHAALLDAADPDALDYYHRQLDVMRTRGLVPFATLNHYTLPTWMHDAVGCNVDLGSCSPRGWLEPDIVEEIAKYAGFVAAEFGDEIDFWATQNEPFAVLLPGYILPSETRTNPPARSLALDAAKVVLVHMIEAHARMSDAVHEADPGARVGLVYAVAPVHPKDPDDRLDQRAARNVYRLYNTVFLDGILKGELDDDLDGTAERREDLVGRTDFLGVNYYTRAVLKGAEDSLFPDFSPLATFDPLSVEQGEIYPEGIYEVLMDLTTDYPGVPLHVTENGVDVAQHSDGSDFLVRHLRYVKEAVEDGADVRSYFWWSLMDNYEWNHGMGQRFGLYAVDPEDPMKKRVARPIVQTYRRIIEERDLPDDL